MENQFPVFSKLYAFFHPNGKNVKVWSIGFTDANFESYIHEVLGCQIDIFDGRPEAATNFAIADRVLNEHERQPSDPAWTEVLEARWMKEGSLQFSNTVPFSFRGQLTINDVITNTKEINLKGVPKVNICKIDYETFETTLIYAILNAGYRPGLFYVHWTEHPDKDVSSMICAGHLQTCGYQLLQASGNYFIYRFTDDCMYECCSWERKDCTNPMFDEFKQHVIQSFFKTTQQKEKSTSNEGSNSESHSPPQKDN